MVKKPLVSIIIVNWNGRKYLSDCLGSLSKISYSNIEVIFVDNASTDDSVGYVKQYYPAIKIIVNSRNLGFAEGQEVAFTRCKGSAVLFLSMDTIVTKNFLDELIKILYSGKDIGAVQPKLLMHPQKNTIDSVGSFFTMNGLLYHYGREKDQSIAKFNKPMEIFSVKGACVLFRKETLQKTGLFDKDFFAYFEETDLCHRIWLAGYRIMYSPYAIIYHKGGGSSRQMASSFILFHSYKNRICTYIKNLSLKYLLIVIPQLIFFYECATFVYLIKGKVAIVWTIQRAILWNVFNIRQTWQKRKFVQKKIRKVRDDDFLPKLIRPVRLGYYYYIMFGGLGNYKD